MAGVGIDREALWELFHQGIGPGDDLTDGQIDRIATAVAKMIDENNIRITSALEYAGVVLKPND